MLVDLHEEGSDIETNQDEPVCGSINIEVIQEFILLYFGRAQKIIQ